MITIKQDPGNKTVFLKIEKMSDDILYAIERSLWESGKIMELYLKSGLKMGARSGRVYTHYREGGGAFKRRSSAAGEFPQRIHGVLRGAVAFKVFSYKQMIYGIENPSQGKDTTYAEYLEEGTRYMSKRKLVGYTVKKTHQQVRNLLRKRLNNAIKGK